MKVRYDNGIDRKVYMIHLQPHMSRTRSVMTLHVQCNNIQPWLLTDYIEIAPKAGCVWTVNCCHCEVTIGHASFGCNVIVNCCH
jgi:hypothetical protein